ncbi:MAG: M28 family peptidase [Vicinamibacterales bacterium]
MKRLSILLLLLSVALSADSRRAIQPEALLAHVKFLSSDELEGRGNGTEGLERAAEYIAGQFKSAGLEPGGAGGSWFQPFGLVTGLTVGDGNRLTLAANGRSVPFTLGETYFPLSATAGDSTAVASTELRGAPVVFAGYGISAPSLGYDDYADLDVAGKAVLIFTHEPQEHDEHSRFEGRSFTRHATLLNKAMTARNKGATLVLVVSDPAHERDEASFDGFARDPQAEDYGIPVLRVQRDRIAPLLSAWKLDESARAIDATGTPASRALHGTADYVEHLAKTRRTVRNVIGILPGSDPARKGEAVVVGAHYDHLGLGGRHSMSPNLAGQIHNGADDNASGTAAIIELARAAAGNRARFARTMVFVAFAGEELGLIGSTQYVNNPAVRLDQTVAMLNLDMVGRPRGRIMVSGLETAPAIDDDVKAAAASVEGLEIRRFQDGAGVGASDDTSFLLKKVPAVSFFSGFHTDYHRPTDDWPQIDPGGAASVASLAYELAARLSSRLDRPQYVARVAPAGHGTSAAGDAGSIGGYGPYFGSVPDFGDSDGGVRFAEVREHSPAAKAGLTAGDVMVSFDGKPIRTLFDFTYALREKKPGDAVEVTVMRGDRRFTVRVTLTTRP